MADAQIRVTAKDDASSVLARVQRELAQTERNATLLGSAFGGLTGGLLAGASLAGFVAYAKAVNNGVDALNDLKDATGASIENLSALEDVGARTGTSFESVSSSLIKFNKILNDAKAGSESANIFKALGLDAQKLKEIDPAEAMRQTAVALSGYKDEQNKARAIQELFGKSAKEAAAFLKDLSEQSQLNATVSTQAAEEAERFNKIIFEGQKNALDFGRAIAGPVISSLNALVDLMRDGDTQAQAFAESTGVIATVLETISVLGINAAYVLKTIVGEFGVIAAQAAAIARGDFAQAGFIRKEWIADAEAARKSVDALSDRILNARKNAKTLSESLRGVDTRAEDARLSRQGEKKTLQIADTSKKVKEQESAYDSLSKRIQEQIALQEQGITLGRDLTQVEQFVLKLRQDAAASKKALTAGELADLEKSIALYEKQSALIEQRKRNEQVISEFAAQSAKAYEDEQRAIAEWANTKAASDKRSADAAAQMIKDLQFENSLIGLSNADRALAIKQRELESAGIRKASDDYAKYSEQIERELKLKETAEKARKEYDDILQIGTDLVQGKTDSIKRFFESIVQEAIKMRVIKPILEDVFGITAKTGLGGSGKGGLSGLFPGLSGPSGGGGGFGDVGGLGSIGAGVLEDIFGGFFAEGGRPPMGKVSVVGERGPELFVPSSAGTIIPNSALGGSSFSPQTSIVINGGADVRALRQEFAVAMNARDEQWRRQLSAARVI